MSTNPDTGIQEPLKRALSLSKRQADALYRILEAIVRQGKGQNVTELYDKVVEVLPRAFAHPSRTCARFIVGGVEFKTKNFGTTEWKLAFNINVDHRTVGTLEVYSCGHKMKPSLAPFSVVERRFVRTFAETLGIIADRACRIQASAVEKETKVMRDISESGETERAVQAERHKLMTILNAMEDAVYTIRDGCEIDYANPSLERRFGPARGRKCYEYFRSRSDVCPWCLNKDVFSGKTVVREWHSGEPIAEGRRTYESVHIPLRNADGTFSKLGVLHDITDRKLAESKLLEYQQRLRSLASRLALSEEHERRRIACSVHDRIGHTLTLCIINLNSLLNGMPQCEAKESLYQILRDIRGLAEETRSLTFEISSPLLYEVGLEAALERLVEEFQHRHGIAAVFYDDRRSKPLAHDVRVLVFQCVVELLMNVAKHSKAHNVRVAYERTKTELSLSVDDDGIGFDAKLLPRHEGGGFGLFGIRERMCSVGGRLEIQSKVGEGSKFTLVIPLESQPK